MIPNNIVAKMLGYKPKTMFEANAPGALHLRTLSTISDISSDQSNTILMCLPIEILDAFKAVAKNPDEVVKKITKK